jgi:hypothetical protein
MQGEAGGEKIPDFFRRSRWRAKADEIWPRGRQGVCAGEKFSVPLKFFFKNLLTLFDRPLSCPSR